MSRSTALGALSQETRIQRMVREARVFQAEQVSGQNVELHGSRFERGSSRQIEAAQSKDAEMEVAKATIKGTAAGLKGSKEALSSFVVKYGGRSQMIRHQGLTDALRLAARFEETAKNLRQTMQPEVLGHASDTEIRELTQAFETLQNQLSRLDPAGIKGLRAIFRSVESQHRKDLGKKSSEPLRAANERALSGLTRILEIGAVFGPDQPVQSNRGAMGSRLGTLGRILTAAALVGLAAGSLFLESRDETLDGANFPWNASQSVVAAPAKELTPAAQFLESAAQLKMTDESTPGHRSFEIRDASGGVLGRVESTDRGWKVIGPNGEQLRLAELGEKGGQILRSLDRSVETIDLRSSIYAREWAVEMRKDLALSTAEITRTEEVRPGYLTFYAGEEPVAHVIETEWPLLQYYVRVPGSGAATHLESVDAQTLQTLAAAAPSGTVFSEALASAQRRAQADAANSLPDLLAASSLQASGDNSWSLVTDDGTSLGLVQRDRKGDWWFEHEGTKVALGSLKHFQLSEVASLANKAGADDLHTVARRYQFVGQVEPDRLSERILSDLPKDASPTLIDGNTMGIQTQDGARLATFYETEWPVGQWYVVNKDGVSAEVESLVLGDLQVLHSAAQQLEGADHIASILSGAIERASH